MTTVTIYSVGIQDEHSIRCADHNERLDADGVETWCVIEQSTELHGGQQITDVDWGSIDDHHHADADCRSEAQDLVNRRNFEEALALMDEEALTHFHRDILIAEQDALEKQGANAEGCEENREAIRALTK